MELQSTTSKVTNPLATASPKSSKSSKAAPPPLPSSRTVSDSPLPRTATVLGHGETFSPNDLPGIRKHVAYEDELEFLIEEDDQDFSEWLTQFNNNPHPIVTGQIINLKQIAVISVLGLCSALAISTGWRHYFFTFRAGGENDEEGEIHGEGAGMPYLLGAGTALTLGLAVPSVYFGVWSAAFPHVGHSRLKTALVTAVHAGLLFGININVGAPVSKDATVSGNAWYTVFGAMWMALIWGYIWVFATAVHYRNLWWSRRTKGVFPILLFLLFCSSIMIVVTAGFTSIMGLYNGAIVVAVAIFLLLIFVIVIGHTSAELHCNRRIVRDGYYLTIVMVISLSLPNMCGRMLYMMRTGVTNGVLMVVIWQVLMVLCFSMVRITINRATTPFHSAHLVFFMVLTIDTFVATVFIDENIGQWSFWALLLCEVAVIIVRDSHFLAVHDVMDQKAAGGDSPCEDKHRAGSWFRFVARKFLCVAQIAVGHSDEIGNEMTRRLSFARQNTRRMGSSSKKLFSFGDSSNSSLSSLSFADEGGDEKRVVTEQMEKLVRERLQAQIGSLCTLSELLSSASLLIVITVEDSLNEVWGGNPGLLVGMDKNDVQNAKLAFLLVLCAQTLALAFVRLIVFRRSNLFVMRRGGWWRSAKAEDDGEGGGEAGEKEEEGEATARDRFLRRVFWCHQMYRKEFGFLCAVSVCILAVCFRSAIIFRHQTTEGGVYFGLAKTGLY